jgi:hypothetical protein
LIDVGLVRLSEPFPIPDHFEWRTPAAPETASFDAAAEASIGSPGSPISRRP